MGPNFLDDVLSHFDTPSGQWATLPLQPCMFINHDRHDACDLVVTLAEQEPSPVSTRWRLLPVLEGISRLGAYPGTEQDQSFPEERSLLGTVASELQNRVHQFNSGRGLHQYNQWITPIICETARRH